MGCGGGGGGGAVVAGAGAGCVGRDGLAEREGEGEEKELVGWREVLVGGRLLG